MEMYQWFSSAGYGVLSCINFFFHLPEWSDVASDELLELFQVNFYYYFISWSVAISGFFFFCCGIVVKTTLHSLKVGKKNGWQILYCDNTLAYTSLMIWQFLVKNKVILIFWLSYSLDLAIHDLSLFS